MNNLRIEKKFVFGKYKEDFIEKILLINGFTKLFKNMINNNEIKLEPLTDKHMVIQIKSDLENILSILKR